MSRGSIEDVISGAAALLFDFDGPLCDVFAGLPAPGVAKSLKRMAGVTIPTDDPLEVLRFVYKNCSPCVAMEVEDRLIQDERRAVGTSAVEASGLRALQLAAAAGLGVAVVTNNARVAARDFLYAHGLADQVDVIIGREYRCPELMKPHPHPLEEALDAVGCAASESVLIGDSDTDIAAAHLVRVPCVALANKPGKRGRFEAAGATIVIDDMAEVEHALLGRRH